MEIAGRIEIDLTAVIDSRLAVRAMRHGGHGGDSRAGSILQTTTADGATYVLETERLKAAKGALAAPASVELRGRTRAGWIL